ncbi:hypothetical protein [Dickeya sp. ws52]|uniref:hypothetical protein n=1 Tax=Dickeya sp. ws52 TaxID=2576377 RepID=UPI00117E00A8|nr:hypothetical protein [Dickeya sp. ws52]TYL43762.1 hypothetical protein FDP13_05270 [Dickeya sp. ws52]
MTLLTYRNPLAVVNRIFNPSSVQIDMVGSDGFITDKALGNALGFANPEAAITHILSTHHTLLMPHVYTMQRGADCADQPERVLDLQGAMLLSRLVRSPHAVRVYSILHGREMTIEILKLSRLAEDDLAEDNILYFPSCRQRAIAAGQCC